MIKTASRHTEPEGAYANADDDFAHYSKCGAESAVPQGRLVLVLEKELSEASRKSLHNLLKNNMFYGDMTIVSGLSRATIIQAEKLSNGLFYNRNEYITPEAAFNMLPWREIWVISQGLVWTLTPFAH